VIYITEKNADGKGIWFTYYGQIVLNELRFSPYRSNNPSLEEVKYALEGAGMKVRLQRCKELPEFTPPHSEGLTNYLIQTAARVSSNFKE